MKDKAATKYDKQPMHHKIVYHKFSFTINEQFQNSLIVAIPGL